jgi:hypothetical protein
MQLDTGIRHRAIQRGIPGRPHANPHDRHASTAQSTHTWKWTLGKKFIALKIRDEIEGKIVSTGEEILGIDQRSGGLGHWFFGSAGFHGGGQWSGKGKRWELQWESFDPDGKKYAGVSDHVQLGADAYTWQMRDITADGNATRTSGRTNVAATLLHLASVRPETGFSLVSGRDLWVS